MRTLILLLLSFYSYNILSSETHFAHCFPDNCVEFINRAEKYGPLSIIVSIQVPELENLQLKSDLSTHEFLALEKKRNKAIAAVKNRVFDRYKTENLKIIYPYEGLTGFAAKADTVALQKLANDPDIHTINLDQVFFPSLPESAPLIGIEIPWQQNLTGKGQTIAIVDTGVDKLHPFLQNKVVGEACFSSSDSGIDPDGNPWTISSLCPDKKNSLQSSPGAPCENISMCEHGTHVAGIAAGKGEQFSGIAKDANIIAIQVFAKGEGSICPNTSPCLTSFTKDQIEALRQIYLVYSQQFKISAVNLSLGNGYYNEFCDEEFKEYKNIIDNLSLIKGIATIVSAGNFSFTDGLTAPACISSAISVGSTSKQDEISSFSNSASFLDILAPGGYRSGNNEDIYSALPNSEYGYRAGTSMAAPHLSGSYAILREWMPEIGPQQMASYLQGNGIPIKDPRNGLTKFRINFAKSPKNNINHTEFLNNVIIDQAGNSYHAFSFVYGNQKDYIIKYNPAGEALWKININALTNIIHDKNDNLYVIADKVYKYDQAGNLLFNIDKKAYGIAIDKQNFIYILTNGSLLKYDSSGEEVWETELTDFNINLSLASRNLIIIDHLDNIYAATSNACDNHCPPYSAETRLIKISKTGELLWNKIFHAGDSNNKDKHLANIPMSMGIDSSNNVYIAGHTCADNNSVFCKDGIVDYASLHQTYAYSLMLLKYTPEGTISWSKILNTDGEGALARKIIIDQQDNIYVGGAVCIKTNSSCENNQFLAIKYNIAGEIQWKNILGNIVSDPRQTIDDMAYDEKNKLLYATGYTCEQTQSSCKAFGLRTLSYNSFSGDIVSTHLFPAYHSYAPFFTLNYMPSLIATHNGKPIITGAITEEGTSPRKYVTLFY